MKKYWPLFVALCVFTGGIIVGSFYDWEINRSIFSSRNTFGIILSAFGLIPGYGLISFIGGILAANAIKYKRPIWFKIILFVLSFAGLGCGTYFSAKEFFSVNGLDIPGTSMTFLSLGISLLVNAGISVFGYVAGKNIENKNAWIGVLILTAGIIIALVPGVTVLKSIFHRPRYRTVQLNIDGVTFHQWWEPFKNYKNYITETITKEEFKSYPSGHAAASMLVPFFLYIIPYCFPKLEKAKNYMFLGGLAYCLMICFSRMLVGAHFLSDVSWGGMLSLIFLSIGILFVDKYKLLEHSTSE